MGSLTLAPRTSLYMVVAFSEKKKNNYYQIEAQTQPAISLFCIDQHSPKSKQYKQALDICSY